MSNKFDFFFFNINEIKTFSPDTVGGDLPITHFAFPFAMWFSIFIMNVVPNTLLPKTNFEEPS